MCKMCKMQLLVQTCMQMQILKGKPHSLKKTYNVGCYLLDFFGGCAPRPRTVALLGLTKIKIPWPKSFRKFLNSHGVNRHNSDSRGRGRTRSDRDSSSGSSCKDRIRSDRDSSSDMRVRDRTRSGRDSSSTSWSWDEMWTWKHVTHF